MRLGIALRLLGVLALGTLVAIDGAAIKTRLLGGAGEYDQYTVIVQAGANSTSVAAQHAKTYDLHLDKRSTDLVNDGYVAGIAKGDIDKVRSDKSTAYLIKSTVPPSKQSRWDDFLITIGLQTPHFN